MATKRENDRRARWYQSFETAVVALKPELAGRINWSEVEYLCLTNADIAAAAVRYAERN